jgi:hypothetical protein
MTEQVILHLGRPKTGTTAIQSFLRLNRSRLETQGISYVGNFAPLAKPYPDYARMLQASSPGEYQDAIRRLKAAILSRPQPNLIYSNEIHYCSHKVLRAYKAAVDTLPLVVVVYLRRQDEDLQAQYMQRVVDPDVREMRTISDLDKRNLNLLQMLTVYDEIFGAYKLVPRIYGKSLFYQKDIFSDFFFATGLSFPEGSTWPDRSTSNISRGRLYIEILRLANQRRPRETHEDNMARIDQFLGAESYKPSASGYNFLSMSEKIAIMEEVDAANAEVARKYFGREDGILFENQPESGDDLEIHRPDSAQIQNEAEYLYSNIFGNA